MRYHPGDEEYTSPDVFQGRPWKTGPVGPVALVEPPGPAYGRPDDKLSETRGRHRRIHGPIPGFAPLHPGYASLLQS
jgi:hypothetical protein